MKKIVLIILLIASIGLQAQTTWTVDSINDSGYGSLRAAADSTATGDTIRFNPNLIAMGSDSIVLTTGEIAFGAKGIIIKGLYNTTDTLRISGNDSSRIFSFIGAGKVVLDSLVLVNGNTLYSGGAVSRYNCTSTLFVKNSRLSGNIATISGGGIYSYSGVSGTYSDVALINSEISGNKTSSSGGGVYSYAVTSASKVSILNSRVLGNRGPLSGGGIYSYSTYLYSRVNIDSSLVSGNSAPNGSGGGIHSYSTYSSTYSVVAISNSEISGNYSGGDGGGIYSYSTNNSSSVSLVNSALLGNSASSAGGGVSSVSSSTSTITVTNSIISGNNVFGQGGGLSSSSGNSIISLLNTTMSGNTASNYGGGVYCNSGAVTMNVTSSTISGNAVYYNGGGGISINAVTSTLNVAKSTISGNSAFIGGGIFLTSTSSSPSTSLVNITNVTITGNSALYGGGISSSSFNNSSIILTGSIVAVNGNNGSSIHNTHYPTILSNGYNVFSDTIIGSISTDSTNITASQLNLQALAFNGGSTQTMMPGLGSIVIDNGNPNDTSDAQNVAIVGLRDRGAAEYCFTNHSFDTIVSCYSYTWINGVTYYSNDTSALYSFVNSAGCDSVIHLKLSILQPTYSVESITTCDSYTWVDGNTYYLSNNTAQHVFTNNVGCDSVVSLNLTITNTTLETYEECNSFTWRNGITYTQSNHTAQDTVSVTGACDSIFVLDLTIRNTEYSTDVRTACDSLNWINGVTYYSSLSNVLDTLTNRNGCDSIITLDLTINHTVNVNDSVSACVFYIWINGHVYVTDNNTARKTLVGPNGCDSIITLKLQVHSGTFGIDNQAVCDSLVWIDGNTYSSNNSTATHTIPGGNSNGCDSVVTLNLTILNATHFTDVISSCIPITWIDGNSYSVNNNTATHILINDAGCDSIVTLNLTILSTQFTDVITSCSPITWIDGITYNQTTNNPVFTILNSHGCDSIVTLDFTLLVVDTTVTRNYLTLTAQASNASYQWIDCENGLLTGETNANFTATINGIYQVEVTQNGCVDTSACFTIANVGVEESELIGVSLYPNPTSDVINIDKGSNVSLEITITNSAGITVHQSTSKGQITTINMAKMATGIYVVTLKNELGIKVEKVVKR